MTTSIQEKRRFLPLRGILLLLLAYALLYSWADHDTVRRYWEEIDRAVFFTLNGSLEGSPVWQNFWAVGNSFAGDILMGIIVTLLFYAYAAADNAKYALERLGVFPLLITSVILAKLSMRFLSGGKRSSASAELEPAFHLSEHVKWIKTKDLSYDCFPSDHGTLLFSAVVFLWFFGGRRFGLPMLLVAIFFSLPRLVGGAHWFTDFAVGSITVTLAIAALALCTPFFHIFLHYYLRIVDRPFVHRLLPLAFPVLRQRN